MSLAADRQSKTKRIGELLVAAGILKLDQLAPALQVAKKTGLPLGRVLVMNRHLNEKDLASAVQAQAMIRDGTLAVDFAVQALHRAFGRMLTFDESLVEMGWKPRANISENDMAMLLLESGCVSKPQLEEAYQKSIDTRLPLGRILVLCGALSPSMLASLLSLQVLLRDQKISHDQAVAVLNAVRFNRMGLDDALAQQGFHAAAHKSTVKLGELFALAGLLAESDIMVAVELGLTQGAKLGDILVHHGLAQPKALEAALSLQKMVASGAIEVSKAAEILRIVHTKGITIDQAASELGHEIKDVQGNTKRAVEFLKLAGLITNEQLSAAEAEREDFGGNLKLTLISQGTIDDLLYDAALRCQDLIQSGLMRSPEAIIAIHYCERSRISLEDALEELAWDVAKGQ